MISVRHPDTIEGLADDCRRVLRDEYMRIQVTAQKVRSAMAEKRKVADGLNVNGALQYRAETADETRLRVEREVGTVAAAVAEYRRVAAMWGVEV